MISKKEHYKFNHSQKSFNPNICPICSDFNSDIQKDELGWYGKCDNCNSRFKVIKQEIIQYEYIIYAKKLKTFEDTIKEIEKQFDN